MINLDSLPIQKRVLWAQPNNSDKLLEHLAATIGPTVVADDSNGQLAAAAASPNETVSFTDIWRRIHTPEGEPSAHVVTARYRAYHIIFDQAGRNVRAVRRIAIQIGNHH